MRFFNTAGPVKCDFHYCLPPLERFDLDDVLMLISQQKYFVLHAPRQVGKTSYLLALEEHLNQQGIYRSLYINVEAAQAAREKVGSAIEAILSELSLRALDAFGDSSLLDRQRDVLAQFGDYAALNGALTLWAQQSDKPVVLMIDEIDALVGDTLISVLRQLRAGYDKRPASFPQSVILCGVRDVRDYRIHSGATQEIITGGSAFNVRAASLRMGDFNRQETLALLGQHTAETGQRFEPAAQELIWELSQGQPWLVNALAYEVCFTMVAGRDRSQPITDEMVLEAKDRIIMRRETHLDQLVDKLKEPRVQRVVSPMLQGGDLKTSAREDDVQYVVDLGLMRRGASGLEIANPIYREIVPRELTYIAQLSLESTVVRSWYVAADGRLDVDKLLAAFQQFFREHSEHWIERFDYKEAGPQLLMQAFLQRIVNSGGRVEREYGLGRGRTDLLVIWPYAGGVQRVVVELKVLYGSLERTLAEGLTQTWAYMDRSASQDGHLVIFDRRPERSWDEKIYVREESFQGQPIKVWGM